MAEAYTDKHLQTVARWKIKPLEWVKAMFGDNIYKAQERAGRIRDGVFVHTGRPATMSGLSYQQEDALDQWGELIEAKLRLANNLTLTDRQAELSKKIGMSIMSSNGNGKDFLAAIITWHFESLFRDARGMATANTGHQLRNVYWAEVANVRGLARKLDPKNPESRNDLQTNFEVQTDKLFAKLPIKEDWGKRHFLELVTINTKATPEEQGESLAGRHADHMIIIIDEWSGIPDAVFKPLDRTLTGKLNICFGIFNPTRTYGYAVDTHGMGRGNSGAKPGEWLTLHWNAHDSDNVPRDQIKRLREKGEDSPAYRIGCLGLPPLLDSDALIPFDLIMEAVDREFDISEFDPVIGAVDAGGGGDDSTVGTRQGPIVNPLQSKKTSDPDDLADWASHILLGEYADVVFVDNIGLGWYLPKALKNRNLDARAADARSSAALNDTDEIKFLNTRARMYWDLKMDFVNRCISIPNDPELIQELGAIKEERVGNRMKVGDKKEIRRKYGWSPNKADVLALQKFKPAILFRKGKKGRKKSVDFKKMRL